MATEEMNEVWKSIRSGGPKVCCARVCGIFVLRLFFGVIPLELGRAVGGGASHGNPARTRATVAPVSHLHRLCARPPPRHSVNFTQTTNATQTNPAQKHPSVWALNKNTRGRAAAAPTAGRGAHNPCTPDVCRCGLRRAVRPHLALVARRHRVTQPRLPSRASPSPSPTVLVLGRRFGQEARGYRVRPLRRGQADAVPHGRQGASPAPGGRVLWVGLLRAPSLTSPPPTPPTRSCLA